MIQESDLREEIADSSNLVTCEECGLAFRSLQTHLEGHHEMTVSEYREKHGISQVSAVGISKEELLDEILRLNEELDRTPTTVDLNEHGEYNIKPYYRRWNSWDDALTDAGLDTE